jgi:hypothetical protein
MLTRGSSVQTFFEPELSLRGLQAEYEKKNTMLDG